MSSEEKNSSSRNSIGLAPLVFPLKKSFFLKNYWAKKPFVTHAFHKELKKITNLPELRSVKDALEVKCQSVRVWFEGTDNQIKMVEVSPKLALSLYSGGKVTVVMDSFEAGCAPVRELIKSIRKDLGTPQNGISCNLYASPKGMETRMHFDQQEVFLFQVQGQKHWKFMLNQQVRWPSAQYFGGTTLRGEHRILRPEFPSKMPEEAKSVTLRTGSVLYMPRGTWHQSQASETSIGLTLTFPSKNWIDVFLDYLKYQFVQEESWREPASGMFGNKQERENSAVRLNDQAEHLRQFVKNLDVSKIVLHEEVHEVESSPKKLYRVRKSVRIQVPKKVPRGKSCTVRFTYSAQNSLEIDMSSALLPILKWISTSKGTFNEETILKNRFAISPDMLARLLHSLVKHKILEAS